MDPFTREYLVSNLFRPKCWKVRPRRTLRWFGNVLHPNGRVYVGKFLRCFSSPRTWRRRTRICGTPLLLGSLFCTPIRLVRLPCFPDRTLLEQNLLLYRRNRKMYVSPLRSRRIALFTLNLVETLNVRSTRFLPGNPLENLFGGSVPFSIGFSLLQRTRPFAKRCIVFWGVNLCRRTTLPWKPNANLVHRYKGIPPLRK